MGDPGTLSDGTLRETLGHSQWVTMEILEHSIQWETMGDHGTLLSECPPPCVQSPLRDKRVVNLENLFHDKNKRDKHCLYVDVIQWCLCFNTESIVAFV